MMKRIKLLVFILSIAFFYSCNNENQTSKNILKDVWKLDQAQINSFDPLDAYHAYHIFLIKQFFNTLTDLDYKGNIIPSLAKKWESNNGRKWILYLRDDVLFIEDSCFTDVEERKFEANDVKFTFERLLNKNSKSLGISYFSNIVGFDEFRNGIKSTLEGIKVKDKYIIEINLICFLHLKTIPLFHFKSIPL